MYQLELYTWRLGQYELYKATPLTAAKKNGSIYTVTFPPLTVQGLGVLECEGAMKPRKVAPAPPSLQDLAVRQGRLAALCTPPAGVATHSKSAGAGSAYYTGEAADWDDCGPGEVPEEVFAALTPQDQSEFVTGDSRFGDTHRLLFALSSPNMVQNKHLKSASKAPAAAKAGAKGVTPAVGSPSVGQVGPAFSGFLAPEEAVVPTVTITPPLAIFAQPEAEDTGLTIPSHGADGKKGGGGGTVEDTFAVSAKTRGRPAHVVAINNRPIRLLHPLTNTLTNNTNGSAQSSVNNNAMLAKNAKDKRSAAAKSNEIMTMNEYNNTQYLGFVEVLYEDVRTEAQLQKEKPTEEKGRCGSEKTGAGITVSALGSGARMVAGEAVVWSAEALANPVAVALPLCDGGSGELVTASLEVKSVTLASNVAQRDEKAAQKLAKERRGKHEARAAARAGAGAGAESGSGSTTPSNAKSPSAKASRSDREAAAGGGKTKALKAKLGAV